jgi:Pentapeptide repeats (8 copies)
MRTAARLTDMPGNNEVTEGALNKQKIQMEIDKLHAETSNLKHTPGLERLKAWGSILTPIATAVTILGTVYVGYMQISAKNVSDQDQEWRDTIKIVDEKISKQEDLTNTVTLLLPFLDNRRYAPYARSAAIEIMPALPNERVFRDFFQAVFPTIKPADYRSVVSIALRLSAARQKVQEDKDHSRRNQYSAELNDLCAPMTTMLKASSHKDLVEIFSGKGPDSSDGAVPMNHIYFQKCDLSGVDLTDVDLSDAVFSFVELHDSIIGESDINDDLWDAVVWWKAKYIAPKTLKALLQKYKPFQFHTNLHNYRPDEQISEAEWQFDINRLCGAATIECPAALIHVDWPADAAPPAGGATEAQISPGQTAPAPGH